MNIYSKIEQTHFTNSEQVFIDYVINHPEDIINSNVQELSKKCYTSVPTIYRVLNKLELSGLNELKLKIQEHLKKYNAAHQVNYNYPFLPHSTHYTIMETMDELYNQTIQDTRNLVDLEEFLKVIQALDKCKHIVIFPSLGNVYMAESFKHNMMEIGKRVEIYDNHYYQYWMSSQFTSDDLVMIITYASRSPMILDITKELKKSPAKIVLISSVNENKLINYADYHLYFSSYEDLNSKIASFSSRISLQYLLDCLFASYFNLDYEKNLKYRTECSIKINQDKKK